MKKYFLFFITILTFTFIFGSNNKTLKQKYLEKHLEVKNLNVLNLPKVLNPYAPDAINLKIGSFFTRNKSTPDFSYLSKHFTQNGGSLFDNYWIIQFYGPILPEWRKRATKSGLKIIDYIPNNSYLVRGNILDIKKLKDKHLIRWYGLWQNAYKIQPELILFERDKDVKNIPLRITTFPGVDGSLVENLLSEKGAKIVRKSSNRKGRYIFDIEISTQYITSLTEIKDIKWIELRLPIKLENNIARTSNDTPTGSGPDANDSNDDGPLMNVDAVWAKGIRGENQIVAEADTGLDTGDLSTLHEDFGKQGDANNPMRVIKTYALGRSTWDDPSAHGTHTAGSMCGNGYHSGSNPGSNYFPSSCYAGTAPKADLVFQSVLDSNGGLGGIPSDLHDLFTDPYNDGARVHSNSWGSRIAGQYNQECADSDDFVWNHPDFVIVYAAGNGGVDDNDDGVTDLDEMDSPGSAKNVICVGSSENYRPGVYYDDNGNCDNLPTWSYVWHFSAEPIASDLMADNAFGMAAFSARGPADDNRIKPDIVAPGTFVLSTKSQEVQTTGDGQCGLSNNAKQWYVYRSGTSMSTPLAAGCCALIQQYYKEGWFVNGTKDVSQGISPSAALVKATLLNGAVDMYPGQYGTGSTQEITSKRPNNVEGWGRVDLYNTLYFSGDSRNLLFDDHANGLTTGDSVTYTICNQSTTEPLKFTLVWTDPAGATSASKELVNDLDLLVTAPDGTTVYYPNGRSSADHTNNIESVDIPISELQPGVYTVEVSGYDVPGNGGTNTDQQPFAIVISGGDINFGCCTNPPAPTNLTASIPSENTISLSWDSVSGVDHYNIYRSDGACPGGTFTYLDSTSNNFYDDTTVSSGNTYSYKITSVDPNGCESTDYSNCANETPYGDCTEPPTFSGLESITTLTSNGCGLRLSWSAATNNCTGDSTGITYNVYRSTTSGFTPSSSNLIASCISNTSFTDTNVTNGTTYYYIVRAEDSTSNGSGPCHNGNEDTNSVEKSGALGGLVTLFSEDFEGDTSDWYSFTNTTGYDGSGTSSWQTTTVQANNGSYSEHCGDSGNSYADDTDQVLSSPPISIPSNATSATLTFYQYYNNEYRYDGTQLYVSSTSYNLGTLITNPAPSYTRTIRTGYGNPMEGEEAWTGSHETWTEVTVDLSAYAGQTIYIQWRFASDDSVNRDGYYFDDVLVQCETPTCTPIPDDVKFFNATDGDKQITLEWVNPDEYANCSTVVRYSTSGYPEDINDGTEVCNQTGTANLRDKYTLTGLTNGTKYYFTCFVVSSDGSSSLGKHIHGIPFVDSRIPWDYVTNATTLMRPSILPGITYFASNTREFHGLDSGNGLWHSTAWQPFLTNGAVQSLAPLAPFTIGSATTVAFITSQDGRVYAVDADTSANLWISDKLGDTLQGSPAASFTQYGLNHDYVYAGTRNDDSSSPNKLVALNASDGTIAWTFDNGGNSNSANALGPINGAPRVDYSTGNIIFATRERSGGTADTIWCVDEDGNKVWSDAIGDCDTGPTSDLGKIYIGTNNGVLFCISESDGSIDWSIDLHDGPISTFISLDWVTGYVYVSTQNHLFCVKNDAGTPTILWSKEIDSPSAPVVIPQIGYVYVGSSDGTLHQISLDGSSETQLLLGDGNSTIGSPSFDLRNLILYVGSVDGTFYAIKVPFQ